MEQMTEELSGYREELAALRERLAADLSDEDLAQRETDLLEAIALTEDLVGKPEEAKGGSDRSVEDLQRAADERNMDPEARLALERASKALAEGRTEDCLRSLNHCLRVDPACFQASLQCGMILAGRGENEAALDFFERTVRSQPGCLSAYIAMSQVLQQMSRFDEAENLLKQVAGSAFDYPEVWSALGMVLFKRGKLQESVEILKYALTGGPHGKFKKPSKDTMVLFCLAFFLGLLGHLAEPCSLFLRICNTESSPISLYMMAQTCKLCSDPRLASQALMSLCKAYEMAPQAFCSELAVFNSTFDMPQWTGALSSKKEVARLLREEGEGEVGGAEAGTRNGCRSDCLPETYLLPEDLEKLESRARALADASAGESHLWLVRGDDPKESRVFHSEKLAQGAHQALSFLKSGIAQPFLRPKVAVGEGREFSLRFVICITSLFPLRVAYNKECCAVVRTQSLPESPDTIADGEELEKNEADAEVLAFDAAESKLAQAGVDRAWLWEKVREKLASAVLCLIHRVMEPMGEARGKRFSALGLTKILAADVSLSENHEPFVTKIDRAPRLRDASGSHPLTAATMDAIVYSMGTHLCETSLKSVVEGTKLAFQDQQLIREFLKVREKFTPLDIDSYYSLP